MALEYCKKACFCLVNKKLLTTYTSHGSNGSNLEERLSGINLLLFD
jgi:hypothetical protein